MAAGVVQSRSWGTLGGSSRVSAGGSSPDGRHGARAWPLAGIADRCQRNTGHLYVGVGGGGDKRREWTLVIIRWWLSEGSFR